MTINTDKKKVVRLCLTGDEVGELDFTCKTARETDLQVNRFSFDQDVQIRVLELDRDLAHKLWEQIGRLI